MSAFLFPSLFSSARLTPLRRAAQCAGLILLAGLPLAPVARAADPAKPQGNPPTRESIAARKADAAHYAACMAKIDRSADAITSA